MPSTRRHSEFDLVAGCDLARPGRSRPRCVYGIGLAQQRCVCDRRFGFAKVPLLENGHGRPTRLVYV
jgi:hypothetical protein